MLARTSMNAVTTAIPGTLPVLSPLIVTSRAARMECTNVATKSPIASWLGLSRRIRCTIRGENCPIASWTTTIVIVSTSAVRLTIDAATVVRMIKAESGPPGEGARNRPVVEVAVERDRSHRERGSGEDAEHRHEPEARLEMDDQLRESHASGLPARPRRTRTSRQGYGTT